MFGQTPHLRDEDLDNAAMCAALGLRIASEVDKRKILYDTAHDTAPVWGRKDDTEDIFRRSSATKWISLNDVDLACGDIR